VLNAPARSQAVFGDTPLLPQTISLIRCTGMPICAESAFWERPRGSINSFSNIIPGCVATLFEGIMLFFCRNWLVVINDLNFMCSGILPSEDNSPLIIDSNAVETCKITLQCFQSIPWRSFKKLMDSRYSCKRISGRT